MFFLFSKMWIDEPFSKSLNKKELYSKLPYAVLNSGYRRVVYHVVEVEKNEIIERSENVELSENVVSSSFFIDAILVIRHLDCCDYICYYYFEDSSAKELMISKINELLQGHVVFAPDRSFDRSFINPDYVLTDRNMIERIVMELQPPVNDKFKYKVHFNPEFDVLQKDQQVQLVFNKEDKTYDRHLTFYGHTDILLQPYYPDMIRKSLTKQDVPLVAFYLELTDMYVDKYKKSFSFDQLIRSITFDMYEFVFPALDEQQLHFFRHRSDVIHNVIRMCNACLAFCTLRISGRKVYANSFKLNMHLFKEQEVIDAMRQMMIFLKLCGQDHVVASLWNHLRHVDHPTLNEVCKDSCVLVPELDIQGLLAK
jgi:hypothetical protein